MKCFLSIQNFGENGVNNARNFPDNNWVLTVIRSHHTLDIVEEAVKSFDLEHLPTILEKEEIETIHLTYKMGTT